MMPLQTEGRVVTNQRIQSCYHLLKMNCPSIANQIKPGQFVMLKVSEDSTPLLRRPFSIYKSYPTDHPDKRERGHILILYKKVGKGTQKMTTLRKGGMVNLIGPLGNGFTFPPLPSSAQFILIGGGVGIVSLYSVAEAMKDQKLFVFIGGKTRNDILCFKEFKKFTTNIFVATEDGSLGMKGTVVSLFSSKMKKFEGHGIYHLHACGPIPMFKALSGLVRSKPFISQVSLETRMGCGFGACWGCVIKTIDPRTPYRRVCKEGPVFPLETIVWD